MIYRASPFLRLFNGDEGVLLRLLLDCLSFSDTYSDNFRLLSLGDVAGEDVADDSSLIFFAVKMSMIFVEAFFLVGLVSFSSSTLILVLLSSFRNGVMLLDLLRSESFSTLKPSLQEEPRI